MLTKKLYDYEDIIKKLEKDDGYNKNIYTIRDYWSIRDADNLLKIHYSLGDYGKLIGNFAVGKIHENDDNLEKALKLYSAGVNGANLFECELGIARIYFYQEKLEESFNAYKALLPYKHHIAYSAVGLFYKNGYVVEQDYDKALEYFYKSIEAGNVQIHFKIIKIYLRRFKFLSALVLYFKMIPKRFKARYDKDYVLPAIWFEEF